MIQLTLLLTAGVLSLSVAKVFYVTPTVLATQACPDHDPPCYSLDQYAQNTSLFVGHTNISLIFLKGVHNLSYNFTFSLNDSSNSILEFRGQTTVSGDTIIKMLPSASVFLSGMIHFTLVNIHMESLVPLPNNKVLSGTVCYLYVAFCTVYISLVPVHSYITATSKIQGFISLILLASHSETRHFLEEVLE